MQKGEPSNVRMFAKSGTSLGAQSEEMLMALRTVVAASLIVLAGSAAPLLAAEVKDMVGKWKWTDFTVECKEGGVNGISCLVVDGPKNKGMEMIRSTLTKAGDGFTGQIAHPATGDIYNTKLSMKNADTWSLDGCTAANVCAKGDFTRIK